MLPLAFKMSPLVTGQRELTGAERLDVVGSGGDGGATYELTITSNPDDSWSTDDEVVIDYWV